MHGQLKYDETATHLDYVNPDAPKGGDIKIAAIGTFDTLNPFSLKGQSPENINLVYDRLMRRVWDEPFSMYPLIAQRVSVAEDRSWVTFHLNPAARFNDGSPITAEDVLFSFETLKEHGRPNMRRIYKLITSAEKIDENSVKFTLGDGYDRETVMILTLMPVLSKAFWDGRDFESALMDPPISSGPYRVKSYEQGRKITYERDPDYWAKDLFTSIGHYNYDTITYDYFRDDTIALESFKKGDLDIRREWDVGKWNSAYNDISTDIIMYEAPHKRPERAHGFIFNMRRAPFDNRDVRHALSLAFDEEWVQKNLFHGEFKRINSVFPNSVLNGSGELSDTERTLMAEWKDDIPPAALSPVFQVSDETNYRKRLRVADELLKKAGWIVQNAKRVNKDTGALMAFEIMVGSAQEEKIALTYQRALERLGITINIRFTDSATFQKRKTDYDYDMMSFYWQNSLSPGTEQMLYWSCAAAKQPARFNFAGICNPALDHFSAQIANAKTYDDLKHSAHIIDRILLSEYIYIPLFYKGVDYIAHQNTVHHPESTPAYGAVLETWWYDNKLIQNTEK